MSYVPVLVAVIAAIGVYAVAILSRIAADIQTIRRRLVENNPFPTELQAHQIEGHTREIALYLAQNEYRRKKAERDEEAP